MLGGRIIEVIPNKIKTAPAMPSSTGVIFSNAFGITTQENAEFNKYIPNTRPTIKLIPRKSPLINTIQKAHI